MQMRGGIMSGFCPTHYKISSGCGVGLQKLTSFDNALMAAQISDYNLVRVSSILPAGCVLSDIIGLRKGTILYTAYGSLSSNNIGETIASAVSIAIPQNQTDIGVIMEYSGKCSERKLQEAVKAMAEEAMNMRAIPIKDIICSSIECTIKEPEYTTVISAVALW